MLKRIVFRLVLLALAFAALELASALLVSPAAIRERLEQVATSALAGERTEARARIGQLFRGGGFVEETIHPYLGFASQPPAEALGGPLSLEALGFPLGGPLVRERRPDSAVIGIFGGSVAYYFAAGGGVERVFAELQSLPRFVGRQLVVVGGAQIGYKQPQSLMALAYMQALGLKLDVVILLDGFNEVVSGPLEQIPAGVFPFFPGRWDQRVANLDAATELRALIGEIAFLRARRSELATWLLGSPLSHSHLVTLCWVLYDRAQEGRIERKRSELATRRASQRLEYAAAGPSWPAQSDESTRRELGAFWMESSLAMRALAEAGDALFFHFLQPNQHVPGSKPIGPDEEKIAIRGGEMFAPLVDVGFQELRARGADLTARGVRFHDLTRVFGATYEPVYVDNIGHVGPHGNEILADAIAKAIRDDLTRAR